MKKMIIGVIVFVMLTQTAYAAPARTNAGSEQKASQISTPAPSDASDKRMWISQDEFDQKLKSGKNFFLAGAITGGVGLGLFAGGMAWAASTYDKSKPFGIGGNVFPGALMALAGMVAVGTGGGLMIAGTVKKHNVKKNYYTFYPMSSPNMPVSGIGFACSF